MRCLLITPKRFYIFHEFLAAELEKRGFKVCTLNDEYPKNIFGVLIGNFIPFLSKLLTYLFLRIYLTKADRYDLIIIIKGRGISKFTIKLLRQYSKKIIGYNFDSFRYNPSPLGWMTSVDKYATFDHRDSEDYNLPKIELFASVDDVGSIKKTIDLSIILKNHSHRLLYLDQISVLFSKLRYEVFIYESNIFTFMKNFIVHPLLNIKWRKYISFKPLDYSSYIDLIKRSIYTVDFAHPKQTGTTIRCFESIPCETKIISNNKYILNNPDFNVSNVIIHPLYGNIEVLFRNIIRNKNSQYRSKKRLINNFVDELLT